MFKQLQNVLFIILTLVSVVSLAADKGKKGQFFEEEKPTNQLIILIESKAYTPPI